MNIFIRPTNVQNNWGMRLGMTGRGGLGIREHSCKPMANDFRYLGHEVRDLCLFTGQQISFQLGMDSPLSVNPCASSGNQDLEQFYISLGLVHAIISGRLIAHLSQRWSRLCREAVACSSATQCSLPDRPSACTSKVSE